VEFTSSRLANIASRNSGDFQRPYKKLTEMARSVLYEARTRILMRFTTSDLAPKFYPVLSSPRLLDLPGWTVAAAGAGAEPSA
jgi:hypothetical protein